MGFSQFNLSPTLQQAIMRLGYAEPTPIQLQAIPEALKGRDIRACAQTGTGKTCAFVIPIVESMLRKPPTKKPTALILTPTRELAAQVISVTHDLIKGSRIRTVLLLGGASFGHQLHQLRAGIDIVVATPGRLKDHLLRNSLTLRHVEMVVLDEADRMLDMGFMPDIKKILSYLPHQRQTLFFSATYGHQIKNLTAQFLQNPVVIDLSPSVNATSANVTQMVYPVAQAQKKALLQALLELNSMTSALIFTRTKQGATRLYRSLQELGKTVSVIHSDRSQSQRQAALQGFKERRFQILVATDIAARGIDVKDISHVINYDVPRHSEDYVHRIGRTGRAQAIGEAFTLVSPEEESFMRDIENFIKKRIPRSVIPDFPYQTQPKMFTKDPSQSPSHHRPSGHGGGQHGHGQQKNRSHNSASQKKPFWKRRFN